MVYQVEWMFSVIGDPVAGAFQGSDRVGRAAALEALSQHLAGEPEVGRLVALARWLLEARHPREWEGEQVVLCEPGVRVRLCLASAPGGLWGE